MPNNGHVPGTMININKLGQPMERPKDQLGYDFVKTRGCCRKAGNDSARVLVKENIGTFDNPVFVFENTCCGMEYVPARGEHY